MVVCNWRWRVLAPGRTYAGREGTMCFGIDVACKPGPWMDAGVVLTSPMAHCKSTVPVTIDCRLLNAFIQIYYIHTYIHTYIHRVSIPPFYTLSHPKLTCAKTPSQCKAHKIRLNTHDTLLPPPRLPLFPLPSLNRATLLSLRPPCRQPQILSFRPRPTLCPLAAFLGVTRKCVQVPHRYP